MASGHLFLVASTKAGFISSAKKVVLSAFFRIIFSVITPVPEPSTYGALLMAAGLGFFGYRRWRAKAA
ncbi:MAG: PEP-CTERM sorting domain-containing protein [Candidatus Dadabacteria bacterium]|nr:MAG: PEP-CTERM sorting domain-containing protein [Candidatus Dadabacteria bacterium]